MKKLIFCLVSISSICLAKPEVQKRKLAQEGGSAIKCVGVTKNNKQLEYVAKLGLNDEIESSNVLIDGKPTVNSYAGVNPRQIAYGLNYDEKAGSYKSLFLAVEQVNDGLEHVLFLGYGGAISPNNKFIVKDDKLGVLEAKDQTVSCQLQKR